jgi:hypothetical protein
MANFFLGIDRGETQNLGNVEVGVATTADDIELRIDTGFGTTKKDVIMALEAFKYYIISNGIPGGQTGTDLPPL